MIKYFFNRLNKITLSTHITYGLLDADPEKRGINENEHFKKLINLRRFAEAFDLCNLMNKNDCWIQLGKAAITNLDIPFGNDEIFVTIMQHS